MYREVPVKSHKEGKSFKILSILLIILFILLVLSISTKGSKPLVYKNIIIKEGDTIWSIVKEHNLKVQDPRKMISEIKKINQLDDVILRPGQIILIPEFS